MGKYRHGGNILQAATRYGLKLEDIIDFSTNTNPLGPPSEVNEILKNCFSLVTSYPEPSCQVLKEVYADFLNISPSRIIFSNGAVELVYLVVQVLQPQFVLIPGPTFREYEIAAHIWKAQVKHLKLLPEKNFIPGLEQLIRAAQNVDLVFLCNPNNPTGNLIPPKVLKQFLEFCFKKSIFVVIDESFLFFHPLWNQLTCIPETTKNKKLLIIQSLTKFYAIPGLRIGCGIAHPETTAFLSNYQAPWHVNSLAQAVTLKALQARYYIYQSRQLVFRERCFLVSALSRIPNLYPYPSEANFLLLELKKPLLASDLEEKLGNKGILIRNCNNFAFLGNNFIRIAVKERSKNELLIKYLEKIITPSYY